MRGGRYVERRRQSWSAPNPRSTKIFRWGAKSVSLLKKTWRLPSSFVVISSETIYVFICCWSILISYWTINKKSIISGVAWSDAPLPKANFDSPQYFLVSDGTSQQSNHKVDTGELLFEYTCNADRSCRRWKSQQTKQQFFARFFKISQSTKTTKVQDHAAVIGHNNVVKLTQLRNNPFARLSYLHITFCNT